MPVKKTKESAKKEVVQEKKETKQEAKSGFYSAIGVDGAGDKLRVESLPIPTPKGRDIVVHVYAAAMNPCDTLTISGVFFPHKTPFVVPGYDGAGVVAAVGDEASLYKVGDEVFFAGDATRSGSFAEYVVIDERIVGKKPKKLSWAEAASVPLCALTAWESFVENMRIPLPSPENKDPNKGKSMLIINGSGGVGSIAIQIAKHVLKLETVVATASREETRKFVLERGADHCIDHHKPYAPQTKEIGLKGYDYILVNTGADEAWSEIVTVLNTLGHIVLVSLGQKPEKIDLSKLFGVRGHVSLELMFARSLTGESMENQKNILDQVSSHLDSGVLKHSMTTTFPFTVEGVSEAFALQQSKKACGKSSITFPHAK